MIEPGDSAPNFSLSPADEPYASFMLSAAAGKGPVVLAFVPSEESLARPFLESIAAVEWSSVIDTVAIFAIGPDTDSIRELAADGDLPFPILSDGDGYVFESYEIPTREGGEPRRSVVLTNPLSTVEFTWSADDEDDEPPLDGLQSAVAAISAREDADAPDDDQPPEPN